MYMNKAPIKEKLWIIGAAMIVVGAFFIGLFLLSSEKINFMSDLIGYTVGFFVTGLVALFFGFILTIIHVYGIEESEIKTDNMIKIKIVLITVSVLHLILMGYLMISDYEWPAVPPLIIQIFNQSFAIYPEFIISSYAAFFATLLIFGIFVLPTIIVETGFLDDSPDEQVNELEEKGYTMEEAKEASDRISVFSKKLFGSIRKIKKYSFPIAIAFIILGICFAVLPYFLLIDGQWTFDPETELMFINDYKGFIRGQFLLIGLFFLIVGSTLIIHFIRRRRHSVS